MSSIDIEAKNENVEETKYDLVRCAVAEFIGTMMLVAVIIGSGIMGDNLSEDDGVALLGNTLATWGILYVLITVLGPVSGAHFNPIVTLSFFLKKELNFLVLLSYTLVQCICAILGAIVAHGMFEYKAVEFGGKDRDSVGEFFSEIVATFGLLMTIHGCIACKNTASIPMAVGLYITAGYWFTASTSFANPAVTIGRTFTSTFAGISVRSWLGYFSGQIIGLILSVVFNAWLFEKKDIVRALKVLFRS